MKHQRKGGFLIAKIHHLAGRIFAKKLQEHQIEINPAQGRIMFILWENDGILVSPVRVKSDLRISIHFFNTRGEIDKTFEAINRYCS